MANSVPLRWMRSSRPPRNTPRPQPAPLPLPFPMPDPAPQEKSNAPAMPQMLRDLTGRLQHMDAETLLLLALLWILGQERQIRACCSRWPISRYSTNRILSVSPTDLYWGSAPNPAQGTLPLGNPISAPRQPL